MMIDSKNNILWNLFSNVLPLLAALIFFPLIIKEYGLDRFGLIGLVWALLGYFGLFDLGLSRALTQLVAEALGKGANLEEISELIHTGFTLTILLGIIGGLLFWLLTPWLVTYVLGVSPALIVEAEDSFFWVSLSIPLVIHSTAMRGVLEGMGYFKAASLIRMLLGTGSFVGPYIASQIGPSLVGVMLSIFVLRFIVWCLHIVYIRLNCKLEKGSFSLKLSWIRRLTEFGGWMTLSNVINPFLSYMDRFAISFTLGTATVAHYISSYDVITKLVVVPMAISGVLFPLFAKEWKLHPEKNAQRLMLGLQYTLILIVPPSLLLAFLAPELLEFWLNQDISTNGSLAAIWLLMGVMINCLAHLYFALVQGTGRADWTAKLHLAELFPYLLVLFVSLYFWGVTGAAFAWFLRALIDLLGLIFLCNKINSLYFKQTLPTVLISLITIFSIIFALFINSLFFRLLILLIILALYSFVVIKFFILKNNIKISLRKTNNFFN